jgi:hypothetical protein
MSALESVLQRALGPSAADLDAPSLSFLASLVDEEVAFLVECPGTLTGAQLLHLLTVKLEETLVSFELAKTEGEGRDICARIVHALQEAKMIQLSGGAEDESASSSTPATLLASPPPLLSAPVRISDIHRADAAPADGSDPFIGMASIQRANQRWSADEERVMFQSLADSNARHGDADELEEEEVEAEGGCAMCAREMPLTRHHLIPRLEHKHGEDDTAHRVGWPHSTATSSEAVSHCFLCFVCFSCSGKYAQMNKEYLNRCTLICRPCHSAVHGFESEKSLAANFNTIELLLADPRIQRWIGYISKQRVNRTLAQKGATGLHYGK